MQVLDVLCGGGDVAGRHICGGMCQGNGVERLKGMRPSAGSSSVVLVRQTRNGAVNVDRHARD